MSERYTDAERRDAIARCRDIVKYGKRDELVWTRDLAILLDALSRAQPEREAVAWAVVDQRGRVEDGRISRHKDKAETRRAALPNASMYRVRALVFADGDAGS